VRLCVCVVGQPSVLCGTCGLYRARHVQGVWSYVEGGMGSVSKAIAASAKVCPVHSFSSELCDRLFAGSLSALKSSLTRLFPRSCMRNAVVEALRA
jgi:hypothetical protein